MEKITLQTEEEEKSFYVLEETKLSGVSYLLVTEEQTGEGEAYILKEISKKDQNEEEHSREAVYEFASDEEIDVLQDIFEELLEDVEIITE